MFLRDYGPTEIGGFGIAGTDDPLLVTDIRLIRQTCTACTVAFDDGAVADFYDEEVDLGLKPAHFGRIWIHTHPGNSALPSGIDEECFRRAFRAAEWSVMFILAAGGQRYARLRFAAGPGGSLCIRSRVDYGEEFPASDGPAWEEEYERAVTIAEGPRQKDLPDEASAADSGSGEELVGRLFDTNLNDFDLFSREEFWHD